jgi:hypothetical protein
MLKLIENINKISIGDFIVYNKYSFEINVVLLINRKNKRIIIYSMTKNRLETHNTKYFKVIVLSQNEDISYWRNSFLLKRQYDI